MGQHYLKNLFSPKSIAVIGASDRADSVGMKVFKNLLQSGYKGKLYPVNPKHQSVQGETCYASLSDIKKPVDLAMIATPAKTLPALMETCGSVKTHMAVVLTSGFSEEGDAGKALEQSFLEKAKSHHIHILGPNCLGIMRPHVKMNATFDNSTALPGSIALVSQSGAIAAGIMDWAASRQIGFSTMISLGNAADIGFGEILDYLAVDPLTKSILLYIEGVRHTRHFMSALRAAARMKPVIAIKAGKNSQGARAALSHTGALIGNDDVFDMALRRAGAVRVMTIEDLFAASEILSSPKKVNGNRLMIITNGGGAGVMAADRAHDLNIELPALNDSLKEKLNAVLPNQWSHQNPIDIIGDATPERYHQTIDLCQQEEVDGILTLLVPVSMSDPLQVAKQVIKDSKKTDKFLLTSWIGENQVKSSWDLFAQHHIPCFSTPEKAVEAFSYLANYYANQRFLMQVPASFSLRSQPDLTACRNIINAALADKRNVLSARETKNILKAFGIPVSEMMVARTAEEAVTVAKQIGFPVVMKIDSPDITHKSDVQGVRLGLTSEEEVKTAFSTMMKAVKTAQPEAKILGVTVEQQCQSANDRELLIGIMHDKVFGPVITFGAGGTYVEIMHDRSLALPPLNRFIAENMIARTRIAKTLNAFRGKPPVIMEDLINTLLSISEMICELPEIQEMDINPLLIDEKRQTVVDARMVIATAPASHMPYSHLAIHPYPSDLVTSFQIENGKTLTIRPIKPDDASLEQDFIQHLSPKSRYLRFMEQMHELSSVMLVRLTQIDYDVEMALVATETENHREKIIGIARYYMNSDMETAEFALVVTDEWQHKGVGTALMNALEAIAKVRGIKKMTGVVLAQNTTMLGLMKKLQFTIAGAEDPTVKMVTKELER